jgi:BirA family biotin operon repressor/biotin-[acetyl-CoA-carboxylase] ligase
MLGFHFDTVSSTNDRARALGALNPTTPVLVTATTQTAGRGRAGRRWHSPRGGAWFSVSWPSALSVASLKAAPLVTGLAVCEAVSHWLDADQQRALQIKWPNDVLLGGAKLAGILCQHETSDVEASGPGDDEPANATTKTRLIVGIGINANLNDQSMQLDGEARATSLRLARGRSVDCRALIEQTVSRLQQRLTEFEAHGFSPSLHAAIERRLAWRDQPVLLTQGSTQIEGRIAGITDDGHLTLATTRGVETFDAGELGSLRQHCETV